MATYGGADIKALLDSVHINYVMLADLVVEAWTWTVDAANGIRTASESASILHASWTSAKRTAHAVPARTGWGAFSVAKRATLNRSATKLGWCTESTSRIASDRCLWRRELRGKWNWHSGIVWSHCSVGSWHEGTASWAEDVCVWETSLWVEHWRASNGHAANAPHNIVKLGQRTDWGLLDNLRRNTCWARVDVWLVQRKSDVDTLDVVRSKRILNGVLHLL